MDRQPSSPNAKPATIVDVAHLAGVSHQTVSRVMNHHAAVRPATRMRVERAMADLAYAPSVVARSLARKRSTIIGVLSVGTVHYGPRQMLSNIEITARARGYSVAVVDVPIADSEAIAEAITMLRGQQTAGIAVLSPVEMDMTALEQLAEHTPVVLVDAESSTRLPFTTIDQFEGGRIAAQHLADLGHRLVMTIGGPPSWHDAQLRIKGWMSVFRDVGIEPVLSKVGDWTSHSGFLAMLEALEVDGIKPGVNVSALLVANDAMALGAIRSLHLAGYEIPEDISVVGFDDTPDSAYFEPPLTTVRQNFAALGQRCVEQLLALIETPSLAPRVQVIPATLVDRLSTRAPKQALGRNTQRAHDSHGAQRPSDTQDSQRVQ